MVATFLNSFVNHAHIIKMANMAQLVNVIAPIFTNEKGMFLQTIYHPLALFANNSKGKALELFVETPKYKSDAVRRRAVSRRIGGVRQRHAGAQRRQPAPRPGDRDGDSRRRTRRSRGAVEVAEVNGPDIKAENDFGKTTVKPVTKSATPDGKKLRYTFPPHSYTMLKARLA